MYVCLVWVYKGPHRIVFKWFVVQVLRWHEQGRSSKFRGSGFAAVAFRAFGGFITRVFQVGWEAGGGSGGGSGGEAGLGVGGGDANSRG